MNEHVLMFTNSRAHCSCGFRPKKRGGLHAVEQHVRDAKPWCPKAKFCSQKEAERAVLNAKIKHNLRGNERRREVRAYFHEECRNWHLTSQEQRSAVGS